MNLVTVTIPARRTEKLSSRAKSRGDRPRLGWARHVVGVDRSRRGGYAFESGPTGAFLGEGPARLPVGAVVMVADYDDTAYLAIVSYDGRLVGVRDPSTGALRWTDYKASTTTLCDLVEAALAMSQADMLARSAEALAAAAAKADAALVAARATVAAEAAKGYDCAYPLAAREAEAAVAHRIADEAAERLAGLPAEYRTDVPAADPLAALRAERALLVARLAEIDALLGGAS